MGPRTKGWEIEKVSQHNRNLDPKWPPAICVKIHPIEENNQTYKRQTRFRQRFFKYSLLDIEKCSKEKRKRSSNLKGTTAYTLSRVS